MKLTMEFVEKFVFPLLETYWTDIKNKRNEENTWKKGGLPYGDMFKMLIQDVNKSSRSAKGRVLCTVPPVRCFWDAIISIYLAADPDTFKSHRYVCGTIMHCIHEVKIDPDSYANFPTPIYFYLLESASGLHDNSFLQDPVQCLTNILNEFELIAGKKGYFDEAKQRLAEEIHCFVSKDCKDQNCPFKCRESKKSQPLLPEVPQTLFSELSLQNSQTASEIPSMSQTPELSKEEV